MFFLHLLWLKGISVFPLFLKNRYSIFFRKMSNMTWVWNSLTWQYLKSLNTKRNRYWHLFSFWSSITISQSLFSSHMLRLLDGGIGLPSAFMNMESWTYRPWIWDKYSSFIHPPDADFDSSGFSSSFSTILQAKKGHIFSKGGKKCRSFHPIRYEPDLQTRKLVLVIVTSG